MKPREKAIEELNTSGFTFKRHGGNHDIYYNPEIGCIIPLKRHDFNENDLRYIKSEIRKYRRERG